MQLLTSFLSLLLQRSMSGASAMDSFVRGFYPDYDKDALIIDVRNNRGGNIDSVSNNTNATIDFIECMIFDNHTHVAIYLLLLTAPTSGYWTHFRRKHGCIGNQGQLILLMVGWAGICNSPFVDIL